MKKRDKIIIVAVAAVVILAVVGYMVLPNFIASMIPRQLEGKIVWIDYDTREMSLEFIHPRSGTLREFTHAIPEDCEIRVDDEAVELSDLRVGDEVVVEGMHNRRTKEIRVLSITVLERPSAESEPAEGVEPAPALVE